MSIAAWAFGGFNPIHSAHWHDDVRAMTPEDQWSWLVLRGGLHEYIDTDDEAHTPLIDDIYEWGIRKGGKAHQLDVVDAMLQMRARHALRRRLRLLVALAGANKGGY